MLSIFASFTASLLGVIPTFGPLILQIGTWIVGALFKNSQQKEENQKSYLAAIEAHLNDSLLSVNERKSAMAQRQELLEKAKLRDGVKP